MKDSASWIKLSTPILQALIFASLHLIYSLFETLIDPYAHFIDFKESDVAISSPVSPSFMALARISFQIVICDEFLQYISAILTKLNYPSLTCPI